jgi:hypothetical protein
MATVPALLTDALAELSKVQPKPGSTTPLANGKQKVRDARALAEAAELPPPEPTPTTSILWGARIDGDVYGRGDAPWDATTWDTYESHTGKKVSILHWGQPFGALDLNACNLVKARGAVSLISIDLGTTTLAKIAAGEADTAIDAFAAKCKQFGSPLILRPWWEMNGAWYAWGRSGSYVAAWRRFYNRVKAVAPVAEFVWAPNTIWDAASDPAPWFPGTNYLDWTGLDGYNFGTNPYKSGGWKSPVEVFKPTYDRLGQLAPGKPIMICETASTEYGRSKADWITALLGSALPQSFPNIKALVWFNWNILENGGRMDWPIESSASAQAAFKGGIASSYYKSA